MYVPFFGPDGVGVGVGVGCDEVRPGAGVLDGFLDVPARGERDGLPVVPVAGVVVVVGRRRVRTGHDNAGISGRVRRDRSADGRVAHLGADEQAGAGERTENEGSGATHGRTS